MPIVQNLILNKRCRDLTTYFIIYKKNTSHEKSFPFTFFDYFMSIDTK